jgi:hypothetical protein
MKGSEWTHQGSSFFLFGKGVGERNVFPWYSSSSQCVPQNVPNSTSLLSHLVVQRGASIGECPMFQKNWWWANEYGPFKKKKRKCEGTHEMPMTRILRSWYMGFFCMVVLDVSIFFHISVVMWCSSQISRFSCNVMFESDFRVQAVFLPLPFFHCWFASSFLGWRGKFIVAHQRGLLLLMNRKGVMVNCCE